MEIFQSKKLLTHSNSEKKAESKEQIKRNKSKGSIKFNKAESKKPAVQIKRKSVEKPVTQRTRIHLKKIDTIISDDTPSDDSNGTFETPTMLKNPINAKMLKYPIKKVTTQKKSDQAEDYASNKTPTNASKTIENLTKKPKAKKAKTSKKEISQNFGSNTDDSSIDSNLDDSESDNPDDKNSSDTQDGIIDADNKATYTKVHQPELFDQKFFSNAQNRHTIKDFTFMGKLNDNNRPHGYGILKKTFKRLIYKGNFKDGLFQGIGLQLPMKRFHHIYEGEFVDNLRHGWGKFYEFPKSEITIKRIQEAANHLNPYDSFTGDLKLLYQGQFKKDKPNGCGI